MGDGEQERAQGAALGVESLGLVPQLDEHLLGDVFGTGAIGKHAGGKCEHRAGVAAVDLFQGVMAPTTDTDDECRITCSLEVGAVHLWLFGVTAVLDDADSLSSCGL